MRISRRTFLKTIAAVVALSSVNGLGPIDRTRLIDHGIAADGHVWGRWVFTRASTAMAWDQDGFLVEAAATNYIPNSTELIRLEAA